ncbi:hypothetical protein ACS0TY_003709 [Phlomoides rotata]
MGDFNEILWSWEKQGGNCSFTKHMDEFRKTISDLNLQDLGYQGNKFTWSNGWEGAANIQVRLDRALANPLWRIWFPGAHVSHLIRFKSDHTPILVNCDPPSSSGGKNKRHRDRVFRFEKMWMEKADCGEIVATGWARDNVVLNFSDRTLRCGTHLRSWDEKTFGSIGKKICDLKKVIEALQTRAQTADILQMIRKKNKELYELLKLEEIWWFQRSRALWLKDGDRNTPFFHKKASQRRRRNTISRIKTEEGEWIEEEEDIENYLRSYYEDIFTSVNPQNMHRVIETVEPKVSEDMNVLPSMQTLCRWGLSVDHTCRVYADGKETTSHVLLQCPMVIHTSGRSPLNFDLHTLCTGDFQDLFWHVLHNLPEQGIILFSVIAWSLWKARNKRLFENQILSPSQIFEQAVSLADELASRREGVRMNRGSRLAGMG